MKPYVCPFCGVAMSEHEERTRLVLLAFESHLDVHMLKGDELLPSPPLRAAS